MGRVAAHGWTPGDMTPRVLPLPLGQTCRRCDADLEPLPRHPDDVAAGIAADPPPPGVGYYVCALTAPAAAAPVCPGCLTTEEVRARYESHLRFLDRVLAEALASADPDHKRAVFRAVQSASAQLEEVRAGLEIFAGARNADA